MLLLVLRHVDADHRPLVVEQEFGESFGRLGLANARGAEEQERADRSVGVADAAPRSANGVGEDGERLALPDHAFLQVVFQLDQLLQLALHELAHGNAGPLGDHVGDVVRADLFLEHARAALNTLQLRGFVLHLGVQAGKHAVLNLGRPPPIGVALGLLKLHMQALDLLLEPPHRLDLLLFGLPNRAQPLDFCPEIGQLALGVVEPLLGGLVGLFEQRGLVDLKLVDLALQIVDLLRHAVHLDLQPGGGFVHEIDRLVRKEAVGDVAVAERRGGDDRTVLNADAVVDLVALFEAAQDRDRLLDGRFVHQHGLEAPLQRLVLLDVLGVLVERGRSDAPQFAPGQHRLEHVRGVHAALGLARAHQCVQLVDEQDDPALGLLDVLEYGLQAVLELATVLGARDQCSEVERDKALVLEAFRHVALHDALGQPFDDGRLAHAWLADEDGVVLGASAEHLHHATNLVVPPDDGVQLALPRLGREVDAVLVEGLIAVLGIGVGHLSPAADVLDGLLQRLAGDAVRAEKPSGLFGVVDHGQQDVLGGDVLVVHLLRDGERVVPNARQATGHRIAVRPALDLRSAFEQAMQVGVQAARIGPHHLQDGPGQSIVLTECGQQHVRRVHAAVVVLGRQVLCVLKGLLGLYGELVESHGSLLSVIVSSDLHVESHVVSFGLGSPSDRTPATEASWRPPTRSRRPSRLRRAWGRADPPQPTGSSPRCTRTPRTGSNGWWSAWRAPIGWPAARREGPIAAR